MRFGLLFGLVCLASAAPAWAEDWRFVFHNEDRSNGEVWYADLDSLRRTGSIVLFEAQAFAPTGHPSGIASADVRMEADCAAERARVVVAHARDSAGRLTGQSSTTNPWMSDVDDFPRLLVRLACRDDMSGTEAIAAGANLRADADARFAAANPPPPEPPPLTEEERAMLLESGRRALQREMENVARSALADACGREQLRCRQYESTIERGVEPVVLVRNLECTETGPWPRRRRHCRFEARHPGTERNIACTLDLAQVPGDHSPYWSYRRAPPPPPEPPPQAGPPVPAMAPPGISTLSCEGSVAAMVAD